MKKWLKKIGADIGWAAMRLSETLVKSRMTGYAIALGRAIGTVLWWLVGSRRRLALKNAEVVLPDVPFAQRRRIVREAVIDSVSHWPEVVSYAWTGPERILSNITVEGRENLDRALAKGRGVIAPSVHLGNFALIGIWMTQAGYEFYFLTRYPHDPRVVRRFVYLRKYRLGIGAIRDLPRRECTRGILTALRRNAIVYMQLDQPSRDVFLEVNFFGRPFGAFMGPVTLALKTGAALVPMYILRERSCRQRLVIEPEFELARTGSRREDAEAGLRALLGHFEGWIRAHPDQWWWLSRRWRNL